MAQHAGSSLLWERPAKWLGILGVLVAGLYTLKGKERKLLYAFKTFILLKTGFESHRLEIVFVKHAFK